MSMIYTPSSGMLLNPKKLPLRSEICHSNLMLTSSNFGSNKSAITPSSKQKSNKKFIEHTFQRSQSNAKSKAMPLLLELSFDEAKMHKLKDSQTFAQNSRKLKKDISETKINKNIKREILSSSLAANDKELKRAMVRVKKEILLNTNSTLPESNEVNPLSNTFNISMAKNLKNSIIFVNSEADSVEDMHSVLVGFYQRSKKMTEKLELNKAYEFAEQKKTLLEIDDDMLLQSLI